MAKKMTERTALSISKQIEKQIDRLKTINMAVVMRLPVNKNMTHAPGNDCYAELCKIRVELKFIGDRLWPY